MSFCSSCCGSSHPHISPPTKASLHQVLPTQSFHLPTYKPTPLPTVPPSPSCGSLPQYHLNFHPVILPFAPPSGSSDRRTNVSFLFLRRRPIPTWPAHLRASGSGSRWLIVAALSPRLSLAHPRTVTYNLYSKYHSQRAYLHTLPALEVTQNPPSPVSLFLPLLSCPLFLPATFFLLRLLTSLRSPFELPHCSGSVVALLNLLLEEALGSSPPSTSPHGGPGPS